MWRGGRKRIIGYLVLVGFVAAGLYLMQKPGVDVTLSVDLAGAGLLDGRALREVRIGLLDASGAWVGRTVHMFPESLYPAGPPVETPAVGFQLPRGEYEAQVELDYGPEARGSPLARRQVFRIEEAGSVRLRGGP